MLIEPINQPIRRQGKSDATYRLVEYCLAANKSLIIGTANPSELFNVLKSKYPKAKIEIVNNGVAINGKSK
jgi:hypothetical protein